MPSGEYFYLSDTIARGSYAKKMAKRQLLASHTVETIMLDKTLRWTITNSLVILQLTY